MSCDFNRAEKIQYGIKLISTRKTCEHGQPFGYYGYKVIPMSKIAKKLSEGVRFLLNIVKNTLPQTVFSG